MRRIAALMAGMVLVVAGCGGSDDSGSTGTTEAASEATTTSQPATTTQPAVESTTPTSAAPDEVELDARALFDDDTCTYLGPAVVPLGAKASFEFDDGGHDAALIVGQTAEGTTLEEILDYFETHGGPDAPALTQPYFAVGDQNVQIGSGVMDVDFRAGGTWGVVCSTAPEYSNRFFHGAQIQVIEDPPTVQAQVTFDGSVCSYVGPAVVPRSAKATFEFDDGGHDAALIVGQTVEGTTLEEILDYFETHDAQQQPYFAVGDQNVQIRSGVIDVDFRAGGTWGVVCSTAPEDSNRFFHGAQIEAIEN